MRKGASILAFGAPRAARAASPRKPAAKGLDELAMQKTSVADLTAQLAMATDECARMHDEMTKAREAEAGAEKRLADAAAALQAKDQQARDSELECVRLREQLVSSQALKAEAERARSAAEEALRTALSRPEASHPAPQDPPTYELLVTGRDGNNLTRTIRISPAKKP